MNIDINNLKRKPLLDPDTTLNFDRFGFWITTHPIVIMEYGDDIVFVNAQTARFNNFSKDKLADPKLQEKLEKGEMFLINSVDALIPKPEKGLFYDDSLVDTTSLFIINKNNFQKVFNLENNKYLEYTRKIDAHTYHDLLMNIQSNIEKNNFTINRVVVENNIAKCNLIWTNKDLYINDFKNLPFKKQNKIDLEYINQLPKEYPSKNLLLNLIEYELGQCYGLFEEFRNNSEPYTYTAYGINDIINTMHLFGMNENACSDIDYESLVEIESFSDYEKDYYKQHPEEYNAKYKTYLETLKEAYFEYENKTKSKSSQNKINKCKDLDDDLVR